ncbi:hypothetical protein RUM43_007986 [Polyplax serrata]|uniref:Protein SERAC1 n=1 Tax=Polyplax serrata TaxID=468196 RepID=A0AAN8PN68_POLSC
MTKKLGKFNTLVANIVGYAGLGSTIVLGYQIRKISNKIDKATSTDVLSIDRFQPMYIYIEDPYLQEEIAAGVTLSKERLKLHRFQKWLYDKIEASFIFRNWFSYKKNLAWRFMNLAQDDKQSYRARAIRSLSTMKDLTDSDYQQLAQVCDVRTAIGLARSTDNAKFLLDPPYFKIKPNRITIIKNFHEFFIALEAEAKHPCFQYFVSKVVNGITDSDSKGFDDDVRFKLDNSDFIPTCLEALLHHSWTEENAKQIVKLGGLPLLTEVYKYLNETNNTDSLVVLSRLISNISVCHDCTKAFFMSGWIKLLSIMSRHKDIRVAAPAQKALYNFDLDDPERKDVFLYATRIYPLHPTKRTQTKPKVDVIFVHGLLGGIFITWRQREIARKKVPSFPTRQPGFKLQEDGGIASYQMDNSLDQEFFVDVRDINNWEKVEESYEFVMSDIPIDSNQESVDPYYGSSKDNSPFTGDLTRCWPKDWLAHDCPEIRLLGINYETNISKWTPLCPLTPMSGSIMDRSSHLLNILSQAGVGKRPIVWVGHSMGGLIVKGVLSLSRASSDPAVRSLYENTRGIVFYSTPHKGSHLAALNATSQMIFWPSVEVQELRENAPGLLKLHSKFLELVKENPIKVVTFAERESTYITALKFEVRFVDDHSADPDVGKNYGIPLDHLCICKPAERQSFVYQKVRQLIKDIIDEVDIQKNRN